MAEEGLTETKHDKIHIAKPCNVDIKMIINKLDKLKRLVDTNNNENLKEIKETIHDVVPTYRGDVK